MQPEEIEAALSALRGDHAPFSLRVMSVARRAFAESNRQSADVYYLTLRDGLPTTAEFLDFLKWRIVHFCIPRPERQSVLKAIQSDGDRALELAVRLYQKARDLFIKARNREHRTGECGELILYLFLETFRAAPQVVSKMYLKTSRQMPVHGSDGIHLSFDGTTGILTIFWGESKLHADLGKGAVDALSSIEGFLTSENRKEREISILRDHGDFGELGHGLREAILDYIDPYKQQYKLSREVFCCFLGYDSHDYEGLPATITDGEFKNKIQVNAELAIQAIEKVWRSRPAMSDVNIQFFAMPFSSVADLRAEFLKVIEA